MRSGKPMSDLHVASDADPILWDHTLFFGPFEKCLSYHTRTSSGRLCNAVGPASGGRTRVLCGTRLSGNPIVDIAR